MTTIGEQLDLTRERIRQLLKRAQLIVEIRWREGEYLFDDLCELVQRDDTGFESYSLCWKVSDAFYPKRLTHVLRPAAVKVRGARSPSCPSPRPSTDRVRVADAKVLHRSDYKAKYIHPDIERLINES